MIHSSLVRATVTGFNKVDPVNWLHIGKRAVIIHRWLFWLSVVAAAVVMSTSLRNSVWIIMGISWWTVFFQHIGAAQSAIATEKAEDDHGSDKPPPAEDEPDEPDEATIREGYWHI